MLVKVAESYGNKLNSSFLLANGVRERRANTGEGFRKRVLKQATVQGVAVGQGASADVSSQPQLLVLANSALMRTAGRAAFMSHQRKAVLREI